MDAIYPNLAMSESKEEYLRSRPTVEVTAVDISPNPAALTDELNLEVDFHLDTPVTNGVWDIETPQINISGIQPSQLTNCGLLTAAFKDDDGDILDLKMVIQVSEQRGSLQRIIYSPLE
ncbi:hypothetical protein BBO99_00000005 [Phytophthora kernoviae]|uniref:Uncharacterized protein n=2 Tax=Phytophthora kernoviae TaxID=325452 RepID=A0A3R7HPB3_9STRA|nr:hypothetical protein G195_009482 [Phytophthora kernoviae 00238/432]KAG2533082.1 hypothetical protein JM16_000228 [Phytophthora kernoviae]KAG2533321.1 hypothetical protein JM18_000124 [Phytophthora kernoviae]RLN26893.1 hypothetical protein BBI17_000005 [Phytophthora kernoviae]RLN85958.1 hypothetical protein BBO99_00000005 [Phytophthora kernoviae]